MIFNFSKGMHFTYNTILIINKYFQLGAKCVKKYGDWSKCTKIVSGEKVRLIYYQKIGKDKGFSKLYCEKGSAQIESCSSKNIKVVQIQRPGSRKPRRTGSRKPKRTG